MAPLDIYHVGSIGETQRRPRQNSDCSLNVANMNGLWFDQNSAVLHENVAPQLRESSGESDPVRPWRPAVAPFSHSS